MLSNIDLSGLSTPAFIYDEGRLLRAARNINHIVVQAKANLLFSLKSFVFVDALRQIAPFVDGFASSSLFESRLGREILGGNGSIHFTSPAVRADEIEEIADNVDFISFNSLSQWRRFNERVGERASCGLRINPQLSLVKDARYDPCRDHSKLGVPLETILQSDSGSDMQGIHFHTNCESVSLEPLIMTVRHLEERIGNTFKGLKWVNIGGGYDYNEIHEFGPFFDAISLLHRYDVQVFIEPGEAIVGEAGYIVSSVVDLFDSEGKTIAVLDTSVNHMPQVYEYQYQPEVSNVSKSGNYFYILAGATCLAGDLFGEYRFAESLSIGSKVIFEFMGAYTLVKAHMFNGINLPTIYALTENDELSLKKQHTFSDYRSKWD